MIKNPTILAIDTSCDDTSVAVVRGLTVLSNVVSSQTQLHQQYGGVFPTVAKQAHKQNLLPAFSLALKRARATLEDIDAIAVTRGPGLAPALEVGINFAKNLAEQTQKPLYTINHLEGHILAVLAQSKSRSDEHEVDITKTLGKIKFPVLSLVVSGGHTQFVYFQKIGVYQILGQTLDDAAGECLDKIGRVINLGYPAGPIIEEFAKFGDKSAFKFPLPLTQVKNFNLSFSGLKTFARNLVAKLEAEKPLSKQQIYDFSASAQEGVFRHITYKLAKILEKYAVGELWLGGGVSANMTLRKQLRHTLVTHHNHNQNQKIIMRTPYTKKLCMDNAVMIGVTASLKINEGQKPVSLDSLSEIDRLPRWSVVGLVNL